jgi:hypothetical protein
MAVTLLFDVNEARSMSVPSYPGAREHFLQAHVGSLEVRDPKGILDDPDKVAASVGQANVRDPLEGLLDRGRVYRLQGETLATEPSRYYLLNEGSTLIATDVRALTKKRYAITIDPNDDEGILDGLRSFMLSWRSRKAAGAAYLRVMAYTGLPTNGLRADMAAARNTRQVVKEATVANAHGEFDTLKTHLGKLGDLVAWYETDDGEISVADVLSYLCAVDSSRFPFGPGGKRPIAAYNGRTRRVHELRGSFQKNYDALAFIARDVLEMADRIDADSVPFSRGKRWAVSGPHPLVFLNNQTIPRHLTYAALLPILGSFRRLVEFNDDRIATWEGGFSRVKKLWAKLHPVMFSEMNEVYSGVDLVSTAKKDSPWLACDSVIMGEIGK